MKQIGFPIVPFDAIKDPMKVLVTGASGFVGHWLVEKLLQDGVDVCILRRKLGDDGFKNGSPEVLLGDVIHPTSLSAACQDVHTVFHLAGHVGYSRRERPVMEKVNVTGTANMIQAAALNKVKRFVYMSSVVAVGASFDGEKPLNEDSEYNVSHLDLGYFETKRKAEILVRDAVKRGLIDAVILNPSTIYGAGDAKKGSRKVQLKVAQGKFPFYPSGGVNVIAVEDVVAATLTAWQKGRTGERYILSGENLTIKQVFELIAEAGGVSPPRIPLPGFITRALGKIGDSMEERNRKWPLNSENAWTSILYHWFDNKKARAELGLNPIPAKTAIENSVTWSRENGLLSK